MRGVLTNKLERLSDQWFSLVLLSPTAFLLICFALFPIGYSLYMSFHNVILSRPGPYAFVGLRNYLNIIRDPVFVNSLWKTAYFSTVVLIGSTSLGLAVALLLNKGFIGRSIVMSCLLIPWAIPKVVNGLIWKWIFDGNYGIFNALLLKLGIIDAYKFWFAESPVIGILLIAIASIWKNMPFVALVFLAALQTIPRTLYEAAEVDGANGWQRFIHVTVPCLRSALTIILILQTTWAIKLFDLIQVLTQGGPGDKTMVVYYYIYRQAFDYLNIGYASAGAYLVSLLITLLAIVYYKFLKGSERR